MEIVFRSDIGQKRSSNQDFAGAFENQGGIPLLILADGMGGHQAGDLASRSTVEDIGRLWQATDLVKKKAPLLGWCRRFKKKIALFTTKDKST